MPASVGALSPSAYRGRGSLHSEQLRQTAKLIRQRRLKRRLGRRTLFLITASLCRPTLPLSDINYVEEPHRVGWDSNNRIQDLRRRYLPKKPSPLCAMAPPDPAFAGLINNTSRAAVATDKAPAPSSRTTAKAITDLRFMLRLLLTDCRWRIAFGQKTKWGMPI